MNANIRVSVQERLQSDPVDNVWILFETILARIFIEKFTHNPDMILRHRFLHILGPFDNDEIVLVCDDFFKV